MKWYVASITTELKMCESSKENLWQLWYSTKISGKGNVYVLLKKMKHNFN